MRTARPIHQCKTCGEPFAGLRPALYCSKRCKAVDEANLLEANRQAIRNFSLGLRPELCHNKDHEDHDHDRTI